MLGTVVHLDCDVLVIGAGTAGCRAAIEASEYGANVLLTCKGVFGRCGTTNLACVVYDAALGHADPEDNPRIHFEDTIIYGRFMGNQELVRIFTAEAPKTVYELERYGCPWYKTPDGRFLQLTSPGLRHERGVHYDEATGKQVQRALVKEVRRESRRNVRVLEDLFVTDLLVADGQVVGATGINLKDGTFLAIAARNTILATGGAGLMYRVTDMEGGSAGDGMCLAYRAGADLIDMEFHQFFPTAFVYPDSLRGIIVTSSALWVLGLKLYNKVGERFMERLFPQEKENVSRDLLSRAIVTEILQGRGTEHGGVWLDTRDIPNFEAIKKDRPRTYLWKEKFGVRTDRFEVAPTYHYTLGGVRIDARARTTVPGLYAAGEVTGGIEGANRLAGNALPECMAFGTIAGREAALDREARPRLDPGPVNRSRARVLGFLSEGDSDEIPVRAVLEPLRDGMYANVGIIRSGEGLQKMRDEVYRLRGLLPRMKVPARKSPHFGLFRALETDMMVELAEAVVASALLRDESRGAHYRTDFPKTDNARWLRNVVCRRSPEGPVLETVPVDLKYLRPEEVTLDTQSARL